MKKNQSTGRKTTKDGQIAGRSRPMRVCCTGWRGPGQAVTRECAAAGGDRGDCMAGRQIFLRISGGGLWCAVGLSEQEREHRRMCTAPESEIK